MWKQRWLVPVILMGCLVVAVVALTYWPRSQTGDGRIQANLYLNWIFAGSYGGEALASDEFAKQNGLDLKLQEGGQGLDPLKLIRDDSFGIAASDEIIRAIEKGAPYVIIGVLNDDSPAAFVSLKSTQIREPKDLVGKRVGILPFGSTGLVYQSLVKRNGIDRSSITEVVVSPDLRPFISRAYDVQPIFVFDETVTLDQQGIGYNLLEPKDWGVRFKGMAYFTTKRTVEKNPELVLRFVKSVVEGWNKALENPPAAIDALKRIAPAINSDRELLVLKRAVPYFGASRRPLTSEPASWEHMLEDLQSFKILDKDIHPKDFLDLSFVDKAYRERQGAKN